jgi:hypothetical protein
VDRRRIILSTGYPKAQVPLPHQSPNGRGIERSRGTVAVFCEEEETHPTLRFGWGTNSAEKDGGVMDPVFGGIGDALPFLVLLIVAVMVHIEEKEWREKELELQRTISLDSRLRGNDKPSVWKRMIR